MYRIRKRNRYIQVIVGNINFSISPQLIESIYICIHTNKQRCTECENYPQLSVHQILYLITEGWTLSRVDCYAPFIWHCWNYSEYKWRRDQWFAQVKKGLCKNKNATRGQHEKWDLIKSMAIFCLEYCATVSQCFSI